MLPRIDSVKVALNILLPKEAEPKRYLSGSEIVDKITHKKLNKALKMHKYLQQNK